MAVTSASAIIIAATASAVISVEVEALFDLIDHALGGEAEFFSQHFVRGRSTEVIQTYGEVGKTVPAIGGCRFDGDDRTVFGKNFILIFAILLYARRIFVSLRHIATSSVTFQALEELLLTRYTQFISQAAKKKLKLLLKNSLQLSALKAAMRKFNCGLKQLVMAELSITTAELS